MKAMLTGAAALIFVTANAALAVVNCATVNRYPQTGRSAEDSFTTMVIPKEEVRRCQEEGAKGDSAMRKRSSAPLLRFASVRTPARPNAS